MGDLHPQLWEENGNCVLACKDRTVFASVDVYYVASCLLADVLGCTLGWIAGWIDGSTQERRGDLKPF